MHELDLVSNIRRESQKHKKKFEFIFRSNFGKLNNMIKKYRRSRLHNEKGNHIGIIKLFYVIPAILSRILKQINIHPKVPIVNYDAISIFKKISKLNLSVLEFGAGYSTVWWSERAERIVSVENDKFWFNKIESIIKNQNVKNVMLSYFETEKDYVSVGKQDKFDLIIIDGFFRRQCLEYAIENNTHDKTIIYLDDSDKESSFHIDNKFDDCRHADVLLQEYSLKKNNFILRTNNFSPTHIFVKEGTFMLPKTNEFKDFF